ncbi:MAG: hypothetical protein WD359_04820 [Dehalococcoidia bacterium]
MDAEAKVLAAHVSRDARDGLIEGAVGPFYVAINRATFLLVTAIFLAIIPVVVYLLRDASVPLIWVVAGGISLEAGAVAHIAVERVLRKPVRQAWMAHGAVSGLLVVTLLAILLG